MEYIRMNTAAGYPTQALRDTGHPMEAALCFSILASQHFFTLHISTAVNSSNPSP